MATELKNLKKGDTVILHMFTGLATAVKEIVAADAKTVTIETRIGKTKFSKKDGIQIEPAPKSPKYANFITEDDGSFVPPVKGKKKDEKPVKKATKKAKDEEPEEEEEAEAPAPKKAKKVEKKAAPKKAAKKEPEEDEEDSDDEYEEVE